MVVNGTDTAEKCEYTCVNGYRIYDPSKPEARCSSPVNLKINITQKKNVADSITAGVSSKIPNNTDIPLFSSGQYSIDSGFFT